MRLLVRLLAVNAVPLIFERKTLLFVAKPWPPSVLRKSVVSCLADEPHENKSSDYMYMYRLVCVPAPRN
jgi:hypothetical protein